MKSVRLVGALAPLTLLVVLAVIPASAKAQEAAKPETRSRELTQPSGAPSDVDAQYVKRYRDVHAELKREHDRLLANWKDQTLHWKRQRAEQYSRAGRTPYARTTTMKLKADEHAIESRIKELESRRDALKADAARHYAGGIAPDVAERWSETDADYAKALDAHREQIQKEIEERRTLQETVGTHGKPGTKDTSGATDKPRSQ